MNRKEANPAVILLLLPFLLLYWLLKAIASLGKPPIGPAKQSAAPAKPSAKLPRKEESRPMIHIPVSKQPKLTRKDADWAHIARHRFVALDIETTGLDPYGDAVVEVAAVRFVQGEEAGRFATLVNPQRPIPYAAFCIHHISDAMVQNAPVIGDVIGPLMDFLGNDVIVGHNVTFDLRFIEHIARRHGFSPAFAYVDTMAVARQVWPHLPNHRLQTVLAAIGYRPRLQHRAEDDCRGCAEILWKALRGEPAEHKLDAASRRNPYPSVRAKDVAARTAVCRENPALKGKYFVFTGQFASLTREEAYEQVFAAGGFVTDSVTMKTDFLVNADGRESTKTRRAKELNRRGKNIQIITGEEFLAMVGGVNV